MQDILFPLCCYPPAPLRPLPLSPLFFIESRRLHWRLLCTLSTGRAPNSRLLIEHHDFPYSSTVKIVIQISVHCEEEYILIPYQDKTRRQCMGKDGVRSFKGAEHI